jgi:hypothetical protein
MGPGPIMAGPIMGDVVAPWHDVVARVMAIRAFGGPMPHPAHPAHIRALHAHVRLVPLAHTG